MVVAQYSLDGIPCQLGDDATWQSADQITASSLNLLTQTWLEEHGPADGDPIGFILDRIAERLPRLQLESLTWPGPAPGDVIT